MKNKQFLLLILMLAMSIHGLQAQSRKQKGLLKLAQQEYKNLRFAYAIPAFKQYLLLKTNDTTSLVQLGNCYQKVNQYDSAVKYFADINAGGQSNSARNIAMNVSSNFELVA